MLPFTDTQKALIKKIIYFCGFLLVFPLLVLTYEFLDFFLKPSFQNTQAIEYLFPSGGNVVTLAYDLREKGIINNPRLFILIARLEGVAHSLKAGGYIFQPGTTAQRILDKIHRGDFAIYKITFFEGWTLKQIIKALNKNPYLIHKLNGSSLEAISKEFKISQKNPEGWFFPGKYEFFRNTSDKKILFSSYQKMQTVLTHEWEKRDAGLPYRTSYQTLIIASLVEKEAVVSSERPMIAGVIIRRLQKGMRLQIDPTVIYALDSRYQGKLHVTDLLVSSPYNTYLHYGLPPTPIASPGLASIQAALHPLKGEALYFVARGDGTHEFTKNLASHNAAIKKYIFKYINKKKTK